MERVARCSCGSASVRVSGEPIWQAVCHCNNCKQRTGSAFGVSAYFAKSAVLGFEGKTQFSDKAADSSSGGGGSN